MSCKKSYLLLLSLPILFDLLVSSTSAANSTCSELLYEVKSFIRVYKDGSVERLMGTETVPPSLDPSSNVLSKNITIYRALNVSARLYLPTSAAASKHKLPLLVYFHGGAFFTSSPFDPNYHIYINSVVVKANVVAVSVSYRLAPEHPLPTAYNDSWLALKWVFSHSKGGRGKEAWLRTHVNFRRVYLSGDSAGGNIAHNMAVRVGLGKTGVMIRGLFLNCPHFWGKARIGNEAGNPIMVAVEDAIWIHAYPNSTGFDDPMLSPNRDPNLRRLGCKKVVVYVAENDVLRDRGLQYKKALKKSKWEGVVKTVEVRNAVHVFNLDFPNSKDAKKMLNRFALFLNDKYSLKRSKH